MKDLFILLIFLFLISPWLARAESSRIVHYQNQGSEHVSLDLTTYETQYRNEIQYNTCERQVPYQEQICRSVPRVTQQCHQTPPQQQCHMEGGGVVCTYENGRRVCRNHPPHQVCNTIPGQYICRDVTTYENVCHYETRYRTETYSCPVTVRVPYTVAITRYGEIDLIFENSFGQVNADLNLTLDQRGNIFLSANDFSNQSLIIARRENYTIDNNSQTKVTRATYRISFLPKERVLNPVRVPPTQMQLTQSELRFVINKSFAPQQLRMNVTFEGPGVYETRALDGQNSNIRDININQSLVTLDLRNANLYLNYGAYTVTVDVSLDLGGEILNTNEQIRQNSRNYLNMY